MKVATYKHGDDAQLRVYVSQINMYRICIFSVLNSSQKISLSSSDDRPRAVEWEAVR